MSRTLPHKPDFEQFRKQAKDLLKAHRQGDEDVCRTLRHVRRLAKATDAEILSARVSLQEAQHALARDYGLKNWQALKTYAEHGFRMVTRATRRKRIRWPGHLEVTSLTPEMKMDVGRFLLRIGAPLRPECNDGTVEGAAYYMQRWIDYTLENYGKQAVRQNFEASTVVTDKRTGQMVALCMAGSGVYDYFVDPAYDRWAFIAKMLDRAGAILAEMGEKQLHVWREDDQDDADMLDELGFMPTGEVE